MAGSTGADPGIVHRRDGTGRGIREAGAAVIVALAMFKVRLIGIHFMDLRSAPVVLRGIFEGYLLVVLSVLVALDLLVKP